MKICWNNIEDLHIPKRPHAKYDFRNSKGQKFNYIESCKQCGDPFLSQPQAKAEFCDKSCKASYEGKRRGYYPSGINHPMFGKINYGAKKWMIENNPNADGHVNFQGGNRYYWHKKAWELFGKNNCENCNLTLQENYNKFNRKLSMHNTLNPKDYTVMKSEAWQCLCDKCHTEIENGKDKKLWL